MANTKSAAKRARQSIKRNARNRAVKSSVRTEVRKAREAIEKGDATTIAAELKNAARSLNKAASSGILHKRNVSRRLGRLAAAAHKQKKAGAAQPTAS